MVNLCYNKDIIDLNTYVNFGGVQKNPIRLDNEEGVAKYKQFSTYHNSMLYRGAVMPRIL